MINTTLLGVRTKLLKSQSNLFECSKCKTFNSVQIVFFEKYFHAFWIPVFPISKIGISNCNHCKVVLYKMEMPSELQLAYEQCKIDAKVPLTLYFGLIIIAIILLHLIFLYNYN